MLNIYFVPKELYIYVYICLICFAEVKFGIITKTWWSCVLSSQVSYDRRQHTMKESQIKLPFTGKSMLKDKYK